MNKSVLRVAWICLGLTSALLVTIIAVFVLRGNRAPVPRSPNHPPTAETAGSEPVSDPKRAIRAAEDEIRAADVAIRAAEERIRAAEKKVPVDQAAIRAAQEGIRSAQEKMRAPQERIQAALKQIQAAQKNAQ
jgi:hypothetical protein